ncbi:hypothetical protein ALP69_101839 [Pseudomonas syringae pv. aceris]|nr:Unknown protein sequence [Pseudomonas syringae pv. syringae]RMS20590.1 hypothetical protein ALP69_101839 [Pseudomonas syringae pv. aceris]
MTGKPCFASGNKNGGALTTGRRLLPGANALRLPLPVSRQYLTGDSA